VVAAVVATMIKMHTAGTVAVVAAAAPLHAPRMSPSQLAAAYFIESVLAVQVVQAREMEPLEGTVMFVHQVVIVGSRGQLQALVAEVSVHGAVMWAALEEVAER
jgi:hypothetical protein